MFRRKKGLQSILGMISGILVSNILKHYIDLSPLEPCSKPILHPKISAANSPFLIPNASIESSGKNLVFIGVMTANKYLSTRAKVVYETWGKNVPGELVFFSSEGSLSNEVPLVALTGVDDTYPPQKKSFMMLDYMFHNFGDKFEWFIRADDDVFIRLDKLENLLRSVDSRKLWFIGQAGRGNSAEIGLLALDYDENFCMGGPGVILSRETLKKLAPHVKTCLDMLYTTHEDVELGRCVRKFAGVQCTWSYEMQNIFYHNQSGGAAFTGELNQKEVHRAITMHPVKQPSYMYRLYSYIKGLKIQSLQQDKVNLHRDIALAMKQLNINSSQLSKTKLADGILLFPAEIGQPGYLGDPIILGSPTGLNRFHPKTIEEVINWELIVGKTLYPLNEFNPRHKIISSLKNGFDDIIKEVMTSINKYSKQRGRVIDYRELIYAYWRLDPIHGADTIVDMLLTYRKYRGHKMTVPVRRHAYLQQTFTGLEITEENYSENPSHLQFSTKSPENAPKLLHQIQEVFQEKISYLGENLRKINILNFSADFPNSINHKKITFILPLSGRFSTFQRFAKIYEENCLKNQENVKLMVVLYKNNSDYFQSLKLIENLKNRFVKSEIKIVEMLENSFSRARALQKAVNFCTDAEIMFFIDVDIIFAPGALLKIRLNTIRNKQIYFPIVFSQFNPKIVYNEKPKNDFAIFENNGFWRQFGFGIASLYKSDFLKIGGFNVNLKGWGLEDVDFYNNAIKSKLKIMRSPDLDLIHVYHEVNCENSNNSQKEMCLGTKLSMLGAEVNFQNYLKKHPDVLEKARNLNKNNPG